MKNGVQSDENKLILEALANQSTQPVVRRDASIVSMSVSVPTYGHDDLALQDANGSETTLKTVETNKIYNIPLGKIRMYSNQPRKFFNPATVKELADSIAEVGQINPGIVRPLLPAENGYEFELVDGERRIRACAMAGKKYFRTEVQLDVASEKDQFERSVVANYGQEKHPALETAHTIARFKSKEYDYSDKQIALRLCMSESTVQQHYSLLKLVPDVQKMLDPALPEENRLTFSISLRLAGVPQAMQLGLARRITGERMKLNKAKFVIETTLREAGIPASARRPEKDFEVVSGFVERTCTQVQLFRQFPNDHIKATLMARRLEDRMKLIEQIEKLTKELQGFQDKLQGILEEPPTPSASSL